MEKNKSSPFVGSDKWITMFADASFCPMTGAYGWCYWIKYGSPAQRILNSGGGMYIQGSNQAEIEALRKGIEEISKLDVWGKRVVIQSDCQGAIDAIFDDLEGLKKLGATSAYTKHVKGHRGNRDTRSSVNTKCDRLAGEQMRTYRQKAQEAGQVRVSGPRKAKIR